MIAGAQQVRVLEQFRFDLAADLAFTWSDTDLCEPVDFFIAIASGPSPTKDAVASGLLSGELLADGHGLQGAMSLTALGRLLVRRFRHRTGYQL